MTQLDSSPSSPSPPSGTTAATPPPDLHKQHSTASLDDVRLQTEDSLSKTDTVLPADSNDHSVSKQSRISTNSMTINRLDKPSHTKHNASESQLPSTAYKHRVECQLDVAQNDWRNWHRVALWTWLSPILALGKKRQLTLDDLPHISKDDECHAVLERFERNWMAAEKRGKVQTWRIILQTFWRDWLVTAVMLMPYMGTRIAQPLLLKQIVLNISNHETEPAGPAYGYAVVLGVAASIQAFLHQQYFFRSTRIGMNQRNAVSAMIYKKVLQLRTTAFLKTTTGQVVNLIAIDASKFEEFSIWGHYLWQSPIEALIIFGLIWIDVGIPTLFGYGVILLFVPLQGWFGKRFTAIRRNTVRWTDARVKAINEILEGSQVIKLYAYEKSLGKVVEKLRRVEFRSIEKAGQMRATNLALFFAASALISLATFGGMWLMDRPLTPAALFTTLAFFNMVRTPLTNFIPNALERLSEARIAAQRVDEFMALSSQLAISHDVNADNNHLAAGEIDIRDASLTWNPDELERQADGKYARKIQATSTQLQRQFTESNYSMNANNATLPPPGTLQREATGQSSTNSAAQQQQQELNNGITLENVSLHVKAGSFVGIIGSIGSGKSSMLCGMLGEMTLLDGVINKRGKVAYASQQAWIFSGTVRANILFDEPMDMDRYKAVLVACCLLDDLKQWQASDLTEIGEKGVNLSGGQRARVALARAVYCDADLYLFDDVLAALDPKVGSLVMKLCFSSSTGLLRNKTRVLVTHSTHLLPLVDHCVLMSQGKVQMQGAYDDLMDNREFAQAVQLTESPSNDDAPATDTTAVTSSSSALDIAAGTNKTATELVHDPKEQKLLNDAIVLGVKADQFSINKAETSQSTGATPLSVLHTLFVSTYGWSGCFLVIFMMLFGEAVFDATNRWLSLWSAESAANQRLAYHPIVYLSLALGTLTIALIRAWLFFGLMLRGSSTLHHRAFEGVLYSSMRFFESNPTGRVLNRFSKDQQIVDEMLPFTALDTVQCLVMTLGSIVIIGIANPWVMILLVFILPSVLYVRRYYLSTSRELKRLDGIYRSPVYALFSSSLNGLMTIRAFRSEKTFIAEFLRRVDDNTAPYFVFMGCARWFGLRLDLMTVLLSFSVAIISVGVRDSIPPASAALALMYAINLTSLFQWGVRQSAEAENFLTSAERIEEYSQLPREVGYDEPANSTLPPTWPPKGEIQFVDYQLRYRPELPTVLSGLSLTIPAGSKVGFCGRTGAGKSSTFQAIFRLVAQDATAGQILIDGVDINQVGLEVLRSRLSIIPQQPVLFSNTIRYNLDPFSQYTDSAIYDALDAVQLKRMVKALPQRLSTVLSEGGGNLSVGEAQLICVARAILKPSKILLIDEATASVDKQTDQLIQSVIRERFADRTVLTIAHRLDTIADSDYICVLAAGRVAEFGSPAQLLEQNGAYASMMASVQEAQQVAKT